MAQKMTLQEIAKQSGVSLATVSRVLKKHPGVSKENAERVQKVLSGREDFRPRLRRSTKKLTRIALLAYKAEPNVDYFTALTLSGLSKFAFDYGVDVSLLIRPPDFLDARNLIGMLREQDADAAILSYIPQQESFLRDLKGYAEQASVPMVMFFDKCSFLPCVISDIEEGETRLARHLLDLGHRKIGYLGGYYGDVLEGAPAARLQTFKNICSEYGVSISEEWVSLNNSNRHDLDMHYQSALDLLKGNPELTALYCYNDDIALAAQRACKDIGLKVPEDVSITGFDGLSYSKISYTRLTTYRINTEAMAYEASRLCYVMSKGMTPSEGATMIPGELIIGESTTHPRT